MNTAVRRCKQLTKLALAGCIRASLAESTVLRCGDRPIDLKIPHLLRGAQVQHTEIPLEASKKEWMDKPVRHTTVASRAVP